jgi:hypothetical protein
VSKFREKKTKGWENKILEKMSSLLQRSSTELLATPPCPGATAPPKQAGNGASLLG